MAEFFARTVSSALDACCTELHSNLNEIYDLSKYVEVGNSGVFRPEMLRTMGVPEDITVIASALTSFAELVRHEPKQYISLAPILYEMIKNPMYQ